MNYLTLASISKFTQRISLLLIALRCLTGRLICYKTAPPIATSCTWGKGDGGERGEKGEGKKRRQGEGGEVKMKKSWKRVKGRNREDGRRQREWTEKVLMIRFYERCTAQNLVMIEKHLWKRHRNTILTSDNLTVCPFASLYASSYISDDNTHHTILVV